MLSVISSSREAGESPVSSTMSRTACGEVALLKLARRHVHGHAEIRGAADLPRPGLLARTPQDPLADARDEADVLGEGNELARRQDALLGMAPADERLDADGNARREAQDGLVMKDELAPGQGAPEPALHRGALLRLLLHLPREELEAVAAGLLRAVHRGVHVRDERLGVLAVAGVEPDPDGRLDEELALLDQEGLGQDLQDLARHRGGVGLARDPVQQEEKLVSADARHRVIRPDAAPETVGGLDEKLVAGRVAERVVHALEMVEVEEHHRERLAAALRVQDREREPVVEQDAVRQVCQRVVIRLVPALLLGALAVRDVDEAAFHHGFAAALGLEERLVREDPHRRAVPALQAELEIDEHPLVREPGQEGLPVGRLGIEVERGDLEDVLAGGIAEDPGEGRVAVENPAVEGRPEEAGEVPLEEQPVTALGRAERLVVPAERAARSRPTRPPRGRPGGTSSTSIATISRLRAQRVAWPTAAEKASSRTVARSLSRSISFANAA